MFGDLKMSPALLVKARSRPGRLPQLLIALTPLLLAFSGMLAMRSFEERQTLVEHTTDVIDTVAILERNANRANLLARNAILLEKPADPREMDLALVFVGSGFDRLHELTRDNLTQQGLLKNLRPLLHEFTGIVRNGPTEQAPITQITRLSGLMEEFMALTQKVETEERRILAARMVERGVVQNRIGLVFGGAVLLNVFSLAWGFVQQRRFQKARDAAQRQLEARVEERTEQLRRAVLELQRTNADLEKFAYSASHDLQEPLRIVGSYVTLLKRRYEGHLDGDADRYIRFAADGARRMQDLITDMVTFSSLQKETLRWSPTPLSEPIQECLTYLKTLLEETNAKVTLRDLPVVNIDSIQIQRVFRGLLSNSLKFVKPDTQPEIEISAVRNNSDWQITIRDNGIGFEPEYAERIFDLFSTLHPRGRYPGTGTGLAIARRVVELHGGRIWAESKPKEGAAFHFTLPAGEQLKGKDGLPKRPSE
jgi:signal transduction histidine kinase